MHPARHAEATPDKPAIIVAETGEAVSYAELNARARGLKFESPVVQPSSEDTTAKAPKAAKAKPAKEAPKAEALVDAPVSEIDAGAPTTEATASEKPAKKAAAPKKDTAEKPAAKKSAAKKADEA